MQKSLLRSFHGLIQAVFLLLTFLIYIQLAYSQVIIPRDGFPYCEPFTNSDFRQNTILGGNPNLPTLTAANGENVEGQGFLRLTNNNNDQRGYVFVDLPFSSAYGLKFSFEYFMYGGTGADGISVFLFDGGISSADFQIGGWGGSLGYAPINAQDIIPSPVVLPGLKGGYLGLGLDAFKNWGNNMEGRLGGFDNPFAAPINLAFIPPNKEYFQSIAVRGPESENYRFIAGKRVLHGPDNEPNPAVVLPFSDYLYPNLADVGRRFSLASPVKVVDCALDGYRKVFVNLRPTGSGTYLLSVDLLVTENGFRRIEPIISNVPYNFPAPDNLKIGFAASTGGQTNFHEIRNVTVEVSDYAAIPIPEILNQSAEVCVGEENLFEFEVDLQSENSFVRCVQLYSTNPGPPDNSPPTGGDPDDDNCYLSGVCIEKCKPENNSVTIPGKGTFTVVLDENVDLENEEDRVKAAINFVPVAGFVGTAEIFYQVIDNYGLISEAKTVTVISNPFPVEMDRGDLDFPTCDGQGNGRIFDVRVGDLVNGFDYTWLWQPVSGSEVDLGKVASTVNYDPTTEEAIFALDQANLGVYTLQVWNPSDDGGCYLEIPITIDQELGTPVELTSTEEIICEYQPVSFTPFIDGIYNPADIQADFSWYQSADRSGPLLDNTTVSIFGAPVTVDITLGVLTLTGLPANGTSIREYDFFVEVKPQDNTTGPNFCPYVGDILTSAKVIVHPEIQLTANSIPDWCRAGVGEVNVTATGGNGPKTFTLFEETGQTVLFQNTTGLFPGLLPGTYQVEVTSLAPSCIKTLEVIVQGPDTDLSIAETSRVPASCDLNNGSISFQILGGNTPYSLSDIAVQGGSFGSINFDSGSYTIDGLAPNLDYSILFEDARDCDVILSFRLDEITKPVFAANPPAPVCEDQGNFLIDVTYDFFEIQSTAVPVFNWYTQEIGGTAINGIGPGGMSFSYDPAIGDLLISNLEGGQYTLYLEMTGADACNLPRIPVNFEFFNLPEFSLTDLTNISCFNGNDGAVRVEVSNGNSADFEYKLDGITDFQSSPIFNTGISAGTYNLVVRNSTTGCQSQQEVTFDQPEELVISGISIENSFCGGANGTINFQLNGGTPTYSLLLDGEPVTGIDLSASGVAVSISDLAEGTHQLIITDAEGCLLEENFTVIADPFAEFSATGDIICESDATTGNPNTALLSPVIVEIASSTPIFTWYYLNASNNEVMISSGDQVFGGVVAIDQDGNLSLTGVEASDNPYLFLLEVSGDKVCPEPKIQVELVVNPLPDLEFDTKPVTCFNGADGEIFLANSTAGNYSFELISTGETNTSGTFTGLTQGDYEVRITNITTSCFNIVDVQIAQPDELLLNLIENNEATCGLDNGSITLNINGGNAPYKLFLNGLELTNLDLSGPGIELTVADLAPGSYTLEINDSKGCKVVESIEIEIAEIPEFSTVSDEICELDPVSREKTTGTLSPQIVNLAGSSPIFNWYFLSDTGDTLQVIDGQNLLNATVQLSLNGELSLTGLPSRVEAYQFLLEITGDGICPGPLLPATLIVNPLPEIDFSISNASCFGSADGEITLISAKGTYSFTLSNGDSNQTGNFTGLGAGIYELKVEDTTGCFELYEIEILEPDPLTIALISSTNPTCGEANGSFQFEFSGGTPDFIILVNGNPLANYTSSITGAIVELKNLPPANYSVEVTDSNGCDISAPNLVVLVNDDGVEVTMNPLEVVICEEASAILNPTYTTALPVTPLLKWYKNAALTQSITNEVDASGIGYEIDPATGELTIEGLQEGKYTYFVEISGPGICSKVETATVEVYPQISATVEVENVICFGESNGSISITPAGGNGVFEFSLDGTTFTASNSFTGLPAGQYTVAIRNDVGCLTEIDIEIKGPTEAISINTPSLVRASCGLENGSISDLIISGGWGNYTVEWRKGTPTGPLVVGTLTGASDLSPDMYFLLVSDAEGCTEEFSFVIGQSSNPVYAVVPPINSCTGNPVEIRPLHIAPDPTLPPAAATEVRWYKGAGQTGEIQTGPDASSPGITYTIDDSDWLNPELTIEGLPAGTYTYYFYVVCTGQEIEIEVIAYDSPEVIIETDNITCFGNTDGNLRVVSGADPNYTYSINGGSPVNLAALQSQQFAPGVYNLDVATPAGCVQNLTFTIESPPAPLSSTPLGKIDPGCGAVNGKLTLTINGGWAPYTLEVFKSGVTERVVTTLDSNITLDGFTVGNYQILITDEAGCTLTTNTVSLEDGPTQVLVTNAAVCEGESATLVPTLDPASTGASFQWFFDQGQTQSITSSPNPASDGRIYQINATTGALTVTGLPQSASPFTYYVTASGPTVCPGFVGIGSIRITGSPTAIFTVSDEVCFGDGGLITVNASGGSGTYTYSLNGGAFGNSNSFNVSPGIYIVEIQTPEGCSFTESIEVVGPTAPLVAQDLQQNNASCELENGELRFTLTGGFAPYTISYSKNGASAGSIISSDGIVVISGLGLGNYNFVVQDAQGCQITLPQPIEIIEVATSITVADQQICEGETAVLTPSVPQNITDAQFEWFFDAQGNNPINEGTANGITYSFTSEGVLNVSGLLLGNSPYKYYVNVTGTGVCGIEPKEVNVIVGQIPALRVSNPSIVCDPTETVDLTNYIEGFNPDVYNYNVLSPSGTAMQLNDLDEVAVSGDYRVSSSLKGSNCWNAPQRIRVLIADIKLEADFEYQIDLGGGNVFTNGEIQILEDVQFKDLTVGKAIIWNWDFGDGQTSTAQNPIHQYQTKGTYTVTLSTLDEFGCQSEYQIVVNVFDDYMVMVPNAFTPDGLKNQFFKPQYRGIASMDFYIFNTWGELIYHATTLEDRGWDGTLNGKLAPNGNYVYRGQFMSRSGESIEKSGVFILIR